MLVGNGNSPLTSGSAKYKVFDRKYTYPIIKADGEYVYIASDVEMPYAAGQWNAEVDRVVS